MEGIGGRGSLRPVPGTRTQHHHKLLSAFISVFNLPVSYFTKLLRRINETAGELKKLGVDVLKLIISSERGSVTLVWQAYNQPQLAPFRTQYSPSSALRCPISL